MRTLHACPERATTTTTLSSGLRWIDMQNNEIHAQSAQGNRANYGSIKQKWILMFCFLVFYVNCGIDRMDCGTSAVLHLTIQQSSKRIYRGPNMLFCTHFLHVLHDIVVRDGCRARQSRNVQCGFATQNRHLASQNTIPSLRARACCFVVVVVR